ncbi:MAG TPA: hypothetical protein EYG17_09990 [Acidimicrobiia bacterium]|nr:hypothetical protein [Acidimicrobiia bacterium]
MKILRRSFRSRQIKVRRQLPPSDWVQPWWIERFRQQTQNPEIELPQSNDVARSWTLTGNLESIFRVAVDPRGLISVRPGFWSLDWWLRVDESWIFPAQHGAVRQRVVDGAPVVETVIRVAGGDVIHRVYGARLQTDYTVVEVENQASRPVALGFAVRPYDLLGGGRVEQIELNNQVLSVDGRVAFVCGRTPGRLIVGAGGIDPAGSLDDVIAGDFSVKCEVGMASAAIIVPLVHGSTFRGAIPLEDASNHEVISRLPSGQQVAAGWGNHAVNACRFVLPPGRINDLFDASRQSILLASTGEDVDPAPGGPPHRAVDEAAVLMALAESGYRATVREILISRAKRQDRLGAVTHQNLDVTAATITAADRALEIAPDPALAHALSEFVADGARWMLANPAEGVSEALVAARNLLVRVGAQKAAHELSELLPWNVESDTPAVAYGENIDVVKLARSAFELSAIDPSKALATLEELASFASPTLNWPSRINPSTRMGTGGAGHDLSVTAWFVRSVLRLLVDDREDCLRVAAVWPNEWHAQGVEVHRVPSRYGSVSWAVRWHGDRPALLWEVEEGPSDLVVKAPGLDANFQGEGPVGEELLASVPHRSAHAPENGDAPDAPSSGSFM